MFFEPNKPGVKSYGKQHFISAKLFYGLLLNNIKA